MCWPFHHDEIVLFSFNRPPYLKVYVATPNVSWLIFLCSVLNSVSQNFMSSWNLRIWLYLEIESLQIVIQVRREMRSYWIMRALNPMRLVYKTLKRTHRYMKKKASEDKGRLEWCCYKPTISRSHQKMERHERSLWGNVALPTCW